MRRVLSHWAWVSACFAVGCSADQGAAPTGSDTNRTEAGADGGMVTNPQAFDVPACVTAQGDARSEHRELVDDTGRASVEVSGQGCGRTFTLSSTASRKDDLPANPRTLSEAAGAPSVQTNSPMFDALYQLALAEAKEASVSSIRDYAFNDGAELPCPEGGCFETGRKWTYVWTRDTAYATDLGLAWADPVRAKNSLEMKLSTRRDGSDLQIVQDTGTGGSYPVSTDRAVWALGARRVLLHLTGEARTSFRDKALSAAKNTIAHDRAVVFDSRDGLYRGEQSFLDWREQSYPGWTAQDVVHIGTSKTLSTNVAHLALLEFAAELADEASQTDVASTFKGYASALRVAVRERFWLAQDKQLSTFITTELDGAPARRADLLGTSLAVLFGVTTPEQSLEALASYPTLPKGPPVIFPQQKETAIYHNRAIWPFVTAYWMKAARHVGHSAAFSAGMRSLVRGAALNLSNMENFELVTGKPFLEDGAYSGPVVNSQRQLWSVAGYLGAVNAELFGVEAVKGGVRVAPFVPRALAATLFAGATTLALNDLPLRGKKLSISLKLPPSDSGSDGAYVVVSRKLNGQVLDRDIVDDAQLGARNLVEIELGPATTASAPLRELNDVSDYRVLYAPRTPTLTLSGGPGGKIRLTATFAGENSAEITWNVYRDGVRAATGLSANASTWFDPTSSALSPSHCYTAEAQWGTSGNVSQRSKPVCFWGPALERISAVSAADFEATGGTLVTQYGRTFRQAWGDPGHELSATFTASRTGEHLVQAVYGNGSGPVNTGITCAVKKVTVEEVGTSAVVGSGYFVMPQRSVWESWGDSSFVRAALTAGKSYRVRVAHDERSINMSAFQHFGAYTGGTGGKSGPFFHVNIAELKLLALVR
jgi:glycogen debranching enzyme